MNGRRVAIDVGTVRVGIAMSDSAGIVASPVATIDPDELENFLLGLMKEENLTVIYVGLPLHLSGQEGAAAAMAKATAAELKEVLGIPVRLLDERLTTLMAQQRSFSKGERVDKSTIDQSAAVALLEFALQSERNSKTLAGHDV